MTAKASPTRRLILGLSLAALAACGGGGASKPPARDAAPEANWRGPAYLWYAGGGLAAYALEQTQVSNDDEPAFFLVPDLSVHNCHDVAFDRQGNLWTIPVSGDRVVRIPAALLSDHAPALPDLVITSPALHGAQSLIFDRSGNLWVLSYAGAALQVASISRFDDPRAWTGTRAATPSLTLLPAEAPGADAPFTQTTAIAFDGAGNLWLAAIGGVSRFEDVAALTGTVRATPAATISTGEAYASLAFDARGALWISAAKDGGYLALRIDHPNALVGAAHPTPEARLRLDADGALFAGGMAVDHEDALWVTLSDRIVRIRHATALVGDVRAEPVTVLGNPIFPDLASKIALRPAPDGVPIFTP